MSGTTWSWRWAFVAALAAVCSWGCGFNNQGGFGTGVAVLAEVPPPTIRFGIVWDSLVVDSGKVQPGKSLSHLLDPAGIGPGKVATLAANSRKTYDVRNMRAGRD